MEWNFCSELDWILRGLNVSNLCAQQGQPVYNECAQQWQPVYNEPTMNNLAGPEPKTQKNNKSSKFDSQCRQVSIGMVRWALCLSASKDAVEMTSNGAMSALQCGPTQKHVGGKSELMWHYVELQKSLK